MESWNLTWFPSLILLAALCIYLKGWLRGFRDGAQLACYSAGIALLFVALESPLDSFDTLYLSAHMAQHLLLMMVVPPLLLLGRPLVPVLRGLPKTFVKEGLHPFLVWPPLRRLGTFITTPPVAWLLFALSTIFWHIPKFYELAANSQRWHGIQHASFFWTGIIFWWPVLERSSWPKWFAIPYLLLGDLVNTGLSATFVFSGRLLYPSYKSLDDQVLAGLIMWVPGSIVYLVPAFILVMRLFSSDRLQQPNRHRLVRKRSPVKFALWKWRRVAQVALLLLAIAVMWDGFFGKQITPLNLAGTLPWVYWRALSMAALLVVGNLFCMACPFMLVRDAARKVLPPKLRWPKALRNKWLVSALFLVYLWAYEEFGLWNSPWLTAWIIGGYFLAAVLIDGLFKGATFCKYVCPIGQFHFVTSLVSPREIAVKNQAVCQSCKTFDCIKGNSKARGCELDLFQPKKIGNLDCTFCLDCVKACPHDNVGLISVIPGKTLLSNTYRSSIGRLSKRKDWVFLVLVIVFGGFGNAAAMTDPVMMWPYKWLLLLLPLAALALCTGKSARFSLALAPIGIGMWAAHAAFHALAAMPLEILLLDAGLLLALYLIWRIAAELASGTMKTLQLAAPWAALAITLYCTGLWILFQPMEMRGMM